MIKPFNTVTEFAQMTTANFLSWLQCSPTLATSFITHLKRPWKGSVGVLTLHSCSSIWKPHHVWNYHHNYAMISKEYCTFDLLSSLLHRTVPGRDIHHGLGFDCRRCSCGPRGSHPAPSDMETNTFTLKTPSLVFLWTRISLTSSLTNKYNY